MKDDKVTTTLRLSPEVHKFLKWKSYMTDTSMSILVEQYISKDVDEMNEEQKQG